MDTKSIGFPNTNAVSQRTEQTKAHDLKDGRENRAIGNTQGLRSSQSDVNVKLSEEARQIAEAHKKAYDIANDTSPIRDDKVARFKELIASGQYKPDAGNIADGMLREAIKDDLASRPTDIG